MEDLVLVTHDGYSGISQYDAMVIRDTKSLNKFYSQINKTRKPGLHVPMIDFSQEMAVVVCMGGQKGQVEPLLSRINETDEELTIAVELADGEGQDKHQDTSISYPFYLYKMPVSTKTLNFQKVGW